MQSGGQPPIKSTWYLGSVSEPRPPVGCSPRVRPFPPRPPPEVAFLCSVASSVLRPHPTSHPRTRSACGYCLPEPSHGEWLAWEEPRAVGDLVHVEKFFARNLGGLTRARSRAGPAREGNSRTPSMYADEKSDEAIVPWK